MEKLSTNPEKKGKNVPNFHETSEKRNELRRVIRELGIDAKKLKKDPESIENKIFGKHYKKELEAVNIEASGFKIADFGEKKDAFGNAKKALEKQKEEYEEKNKKESSENRAQIDYEAILKETPEIGQTQKIRKNISDLKDFRMKRMFEILNPKVSIAVKTRNESVLETIREEIGENEKSLGQMDPTVLREAEILGYKENLAESGHICITPSVEKDLEAIGDRMLTGRPMFLHGPTGTGKTSLARFAAARFTNNGSEMVFCNPQTRETNVWGKTGIRPAKGGAIETVEIYGPLAKGMTEGKVVIFDEFTALPKEQMVFIKGVFNAKVGDKINIVGNGIVEIKPGFQMIFTANLKSEKNPERQDLPPEIAREFEQNNAKVNYLPPDEAYDVALARLLNKDGSLDMSDYDIETTLPNLCKVMAEIQESYTSETNRDTARRVGAMDASGKMHSLKKFVMTQGSVEAILSSWTIERQTKKKERSFSEFLDERFKTALTFEEYSKEDRILVAKILASRGFLLTLTAQELNLPDEIFQLNTIKSMRGKSAIEELKRLSDNIVHLSLEEVAKIDPFHKRANVFKQRAEAFLNPNENTSGENGLAPERKNENPEISVEYVYTNPATKKVERKETIVLNIEKKLEEFISFYQTADVDISSDFEKEIQDIWKENQDAMREAIEKEGFNDLILMPGNLSLPDLNKKMTRGYNETWESDNFKEGGGFRDAKSHSTDETCIVLVHRTQNLEDRSDLKATLNIQGKDVPLDETLTLEDYLVYQKKYFDETGNHLDADGWTWLATKSGARLVASDWSPGYGRLGVDARDLGNRSDSLGRRPSRSFS